MYKIMNEEQEKFDERFERPNNLKLLVDFESLESSEKEVIKNQMEIPIIKYKKKNILKIEEVDLRKKNKNQNSLF